MSLTVATKNNQRLTVPIQDENRAMLAYNMLAYMTGNRVEFHVNDTRLDVPGDSEIPPNERLQLIDENGNTVEPVIDQELFGTEDDGKAAKKAALEKAKQQAIENGEGEYWDDDFESELQEPYTVCSYDKEDHTRVWFAPEVWDYDKANDMYNVMHHAMDESVAMVVTRDPERGYNDEVPVSINIDDVSVVNMDGDVLGEHNNPEWAEESVQEKSEVTLTAEDLAGLDNTDSMKL